MSHTPGPWKLAVDDEGDWNAEPDGGGDCSWWCVRADKTTVAIAVNSVIGESEFNANARLIASAPALLEALREARSTIASVTMLDMTKGDVPMHPKMLAMIDAAISLATGDE